MRLKLALKKLFFLRLEQADCIAAKKTSSIVTDPN